MKKLLTAVCATLALMLSPAWAQMADDPSVLLAKIQADKKGVVEKSLNLTPAEAKKFWPLYEKFQRELEGYSARLKAMTQGRASWTMSLSHYELAPPQIQQQLAAEYQSKRKQVEEE